MARGHIDTGGAIIDFEYWKENGVLEYEISYIFGGVEYPGRHIREYLNKIGPGIMGEIETNKRYRVEIKEMSGYDFTGLDLIYPGLTREQAFKIYKEKQNFKKYIIIITHNVYDSLLEMRIDEEVLEEIIEN